MKKKKASTLGRIFGFVKKYRFAVILSLIFALLSVALTLYVPVLIGRAIDLIISKGNVDFTGIAPILVRAAICVAGAAVLQWFMNALNNKITFETVKDIRELSFAKLQKLPIKYSDNHPIGETVSRIIADADQVADGLLLGFSQLFTGIATIIGTILFMLSISPVITLVVVVLTPASIFVAKFIARHTHDMFTAQSEARAELTAFTAENIDNRDVVKVFSNEGSALGKFEKMNAEYADTALKSTFFSSLTNPSTRFVNGLVYAGVGVFGALSALGIFGGGMTIGGLASFLSYADQYTKPFNEISGVITELQNALACAERIFELLDEKEEESDTGKPKLPDVQGNVTFSNVSFSYSTDRPLIENLNLEVKSGSRIAIVGPTGCGKTTLINLLMRFYDVCGGEIKIDGTDINAVTRNSLRKKYGMVLQETWLKQATVRENIAFGNPQATDKEIEQAARAAHAHSFIKQLPDGYETVLDENGSGLSQGQRQLLCIARIMLLDPDILILDEATSSIDTRTELKIQSAFSKLMQNKTSFIVAHRLSTIREADVILVMKDGHIIEKGSHNELLKRHGFYYNLYNSQFDN